MQEIMLSSKVIHAPTPIADRPYAGWRFDKNVNTGQNVISHNAAASALVATPVPHPVYSNVLLPAAGVSVGLSPLSLFQAVTGDYTYEFWGTLQGDSGYTRFLSMFNSGSSLGLTLQTGDGGYGHRLMLAVSGAVWTIPITRTTLKSWTHMTVMRLGTQTMLAVNGAWQQFASGTSTSYGSKFINNAFGFGASVASLYLGNSNAGVPAIVGEIALWNTAKYASGGVAADFTPPPAPFVWP